MPREPMIIITGFGPFGNYSVNASWESVKLLPDLWDHEQVKIKVLEVPVSYEDVKGLNFKTEYPNVVAIVNVGVSSIAKNVTLESVGRNSSYNRPDIHDKCPPGFVCFTDGDMELQTKFDLEQLIYKVNSNGDPTVTACVSCDAGRYLCDFIYYKSLFDFDGNAIFVHVPPLEAPYSAKQMAEALKHIVEGIVAQIIP